MNWLGDQGIVVTLQTSLVCLLMINLLAFILRKQWWTPTRLQNLMALQGIKGPSYRLIHGNTKQISDMKKETVSSSTTLFSHNTFSQVQPHIHLWTKRYGKIYLQWNGCQAQLVITEPEMCREILENKDGSFLKLMPQGNIKKLKGDGLPRSVGAKWAKLRKLADQAYHGESLKSMIPAMIVGTETMLQRTAFGSSYLEGLSVFERIIKLSSFIFKSPVKHRLPGIRTHDEVESEKLDKEIRDTLLDIVRKRENKAMTTGGEENFGSDFLGLLIKTRHDSNDNKRISVEDLVNECKTFCFARQETINALTWTIFLLALHTDWQEEARKEVLEVFGKQAPNPNNIFKLKTHSTMSHKLWGQDVQLFNPERFSEGVAKASRNNRAAFLPFGMGPSNLRGLQLCDHRSKIVLSMILQRHTITISPTYVHSPCEFLTLQPKHGVQVVLHSRTNT
ncbi:hypothetical protein M0R45_018999 [Rubus argutus]|uniref:Cytochrome P450 n=1 Tax=Rubus argutus TaxID=59490 RepID=A0AAW1X491_RUBAR